jgi:DnaA regulatory inactivator Hda
MPQIPLPLSLPAIFLAENFFVSSCNKAAYDTVLGKWESHALYLYGQKGAGKSHLASIWAQKFGAEVVFCNAINHAEITGNIVVEDIENCADETALFHLFNHCKNSGTKLLMTSAILPSALPFSLPDLTSRLRACALASINEPDDELLGAVLRKQFADRQLLVDDAVIAYLLPRMERSFAGVTELVEKLDQNALAEQKNITVAFARKIL